MVKAILFDLDGTLLRCDTYAMVGAYLKALCGYMAERTGLPEKEIEQAVWAGTYAMMARGAGKNIDRFLEAFCKKTGLPKGINNAINHFYEEGYDAMRVFAQPEPRVKDVVAAAKANGRTLVLATSPLLPELPARKRMRWAGLDEGDFALITHCDNMETSKPDPEYFLEIGRMLGLAPHEMAVVGNDGKDDGGAVAAGLPLFILTGCEINMDALPAGVPCGGFDALLAWLGAL